jgi:hypothetical protein
MKYKILDWAGNEVFGKDVYPSFDAADEALNEYIEIMINATNANDDNEDDDDIFYAEKDEYQIVEIKE